MEQKSSVEFDNTELTDARQGYSSISAGKPKLPVSSQKPSYETMPLAAQNGFRH
jgi:hypothetical protein